MPPVPELTQREHAAIQELGTAMRTIGNTFMDDEGDPHLMRVAIEIIRESADVLESVATRWEMCRALDQ